MRFTKHMYYFFFFKDVQRPCVRLGNLLSANAAIAAKAQMTFRADTRLVVEQPKGTWMFKRQVFQDLVSKFNLSTTLTYQGFFGADLLKPTYFLHNFSSVSTLERKCTKPLRLLHSRRSKAKLQRSGKSYYQFDRHGGVSGTKHLQSSSVYPQCLITTIFKIWVASRF